MSSLILRGYERFDRIITRGCGTGWLGKIVAEVLDFMSKFTRVVEFDSRREKRGI